MIRALTIAVYLALLVIACVMTLIARRAPDFLARPGDMLDITLADPTARLAILTFWWWLGLHFLVTEA